MLGPNGAGKTTIIQMMLGLITPSSGKIEILGMDLARHRLAILNRVNFSSAYVYLPSNLTVWENLNVFARLYNIKNPRSKIEELLEFFEIADTIDHRTGALSTGQLTRLNLAKALLNEPEILFLDEPTSSLDPEIADRVRRLLRYIQTERGMSVVYTSHNMREVEEMCSRVLFLYKGKILIEGTPGDIKKQANAGSLEDVFITIARKGVPEAQAPPAPPADGVPPDAGAGEKSEED